ncbi:MAG TPA: ATP-binding protein, partial [Terriglobales bacterium]
IELRWRRKDDRVIIVRVSGRVVTDTNGEPLSFEMIAEDVTERRTLEEQLRHSQKMEAVGRLAGGIAHDFNNLLTVIKGYSELILDQVNANDPLRDEVEEIKKAATRATGLTRQLLAFSRQQVMSPRVLDINSVVSNMEKLLRRLVGEEIRLNIALEPDSLHIQADQGQIEQVIMNLAVNARDAISGNGHVTIESSRTFVNHAFTREHSDARPGHYVVLTVRDTGTGISEEVKSHIFEPFFTTKELGKGTGLGLSTVYGIVQQSKGFITFESSAATGTAFHIYLPRVDEGVEQPESNLDCVDDQRGSGTVLLVEDEDGVRHLVRHVLHRRGYTVLDARHAGEALILCERHKGNIDLLVTDVVLEQISGPELAQRLKRLRPEMRVLYMSGYAPDLNQKFPEVNANNFIAKPFNADALARKVHDSLRDTRALAARV